ncbi:vps53 n-terminal protein, partial [Cystoisospora suis]
MESPSPPRHSLSSSSSSSPSPPSAEVLSTCIHQLNEEFPTIASLSSLDSRMSSLQTRLRALDKDILVAVREQARRSSSSSSSSSTSLQSFRQCVKDLVAGLNSMKERADSSDRRVTKICDDIKRLALAKDNLTLSISTLKRLVMLMTALDRL